MKADFFSSSSDSFRITVALVFFVACASALADDLTGAESFVCAPAQVNICFEDGRCESAMPWDVNVPRFLEINLKQKSVATTEASGENRLTPIQSMLEEAGTVYLQGVENGRAFSFVINRPSGLMSVAVAREYLTVTGFGACTPMT
ncbi:hypothetical protein NOR53_2452 [gamma proteobacterium NOR5-3]|nr:hypothetical protein NOR53_2452 [gamma proteobacterium NOR5-3]